MTMMTKRMRKTKRKKTRKMSCVSVSLDLVVYCLSSRLFLFLVVCECQTCMPQSPSLRWAIVLCTFDRECICPCHLFPVFASNPPAPANWFALTLCLSCTCDGDHCRTQDTPWWFGRTFPCPPAQTWTCVYAPVWGSWLCPPFSGFGSTVPILASCVVDELTMGREWPSSQALRSLVFPESLFPVQVSQAPSKGCPSLVCPL